MLTWQRTKDLGRKAWRWTQNDFLPFLKRGTWPLLFAAFICVAYFALRAHIVSICSDGGLCPRTETGALTLNLIQQPNTQATEGCCGPAGESSKQSRWSFSSWALGAFPTDPYHKFTFLALLLSIFVAMAINFYSPDDYRALRIKDVWVASLGTVIPTLQALAVVVALLTVENLKWHSIATLFYLWLFVAWDLIIWHANPTVKKPPKKGNDLRVRIKEYLWRIDFPFAFTFLFLFILIRSTNLNDGSEPFIAGVLAAQAIAAFCGLVIVVIDEYQRFAAEKRKKGAPVPAPVIP